MGSSSTRHQFEPVFVNPTPYRPPGTPAQRTLCALFAEALDTHRVGLDDSFFDLGGQSLNAIRLINLIDAAIGVKVPIEELFDFPTVAELDRHLHG